MDRKRYPIGKFEKPDMISGDLLSEWIAIIAAFPDDLAKAIENLSDQQLDTAYREGGWTVRQVVHHCADANMNAFCRFKLALTEDSPVIKPYVEDRWAELADSKAIALDASLAILNGLHQRWAILLRSFIATDLERGFIHPDHGRKIGIAEAVGMYAWHCRHHLAHITMLKAEKSW